MWFYDKVGFICKGATNGMNGFYVKVVDDTQNTGGYYVLYSRNFADITAEGYDEWYPDIEPINCLFRELNVEWEI